MNRFRPSAHVHWQRFDSELVVLDLQGGQYYALNDVASSVFEHVCGGRTQDEIVQDLVNVYEVDREALEKDVRQLVRELIARNLVVIDNAL
jgi:coenzyme PQQ synthesis protein D (PqqD)